LKLLLLLVEFDFFFSLNSPVVVKWTPSSCEEPMDLVKSFISLIKRLLVLLLLLLLLLLLCCCC